MPQNYVPIFLFLAVVGVLIPVTLVVARIVRTQNPNRRHPNGPGFRLVTGAPLRSMTVPQTISALRGAGIPVTHVALINAKDVGPLVEGPGDFAYPYAIQADDGKVHLVFTSQGRTVINRAVLDERWLLDAKPLTEKTP